MSELLGLLPALLSDFTVRNVLLAAVLLGATSGVLGSFAVLRQESLLGDTLSHAALPGIALGFLAAGGRHLAPILGGALLAGVLAALSVLVLTNRSRLKSDAALGSVLSVFFALGLVLLTLIGSRGDAAQAGLESFLFGQAATVVPSDVQLMLAVALPALSVVALLWKEFKVATFDPGFARSLGLPLRALELTLTLLITLAVVIGLQLVGVVLMASMLVAPAAAARQWSATLSRMVLLSAFFGAASGVAGTLLSTGARGLATGPLIVIAASVLVAVSLLFAPGRGLIWAALEARQAERGLGRRQLLADLYALAREHSDPEYATETGMLKSYYGKNPKRLLRRLEREGRVRSTRHMAGEGLHWSLTERGSREAEAHLANLGRVEP